MAVIKNIVPTLGEDAKPFLWSVGFDESDNDLRARDPTEGDSFLKGDSGHDS